MHDDINYIAVPIAFVKEAIEGNTKPLKKWMGITHSESTSKILDSTPDHYHLSPIKDENGVDGDESLALASITTSVGSSQTSPSPTPSVVASESDGQSSTTSNTNSGSQPSPPISPSSEKGSVEQVFDAWLRIFHDGKKRKPSLLPERRRRINARLRRFSVEDLILVMEFVRTQPWWMGDNPNSKAYTGIQNIFRNDERVESFLADIEDDGFTSESQAESKDELKARLIDLGSKRRAGNATLDERTELGAKMAQLRDEFGEDFEWTTGAFSTI